MDVNSMKSAISSAYANHKWMSVSFHGIGQHPDETNPDSGFWCTVEDFTAILDHIAGLGYTVVPHREGIDYETRACEQAFLPSRYPLHQKIANTRTFSDVAEMNTLMAFFSGRRIGEYALTAWRLVYQMVIAGGVIFKYNYDYGTVQSRRRHRRHDIGRVHHASVGKTPAGRRLPRGEAVSRPAQGHGVSFHFYRRKGLRGSKAGWDGQ